MLAALWTGVILLAGSDLGSVTTTSRFLGPLLRWLFPDTAQATLDQLYFLVREAAHVTEYGVLSLLAQHALGFRWTRIAPRTAGALACVLLVAAVDETRQAFTPSRTGSLGDVGLDTLGGVLALGAAFAYTRAMHSWRAARERS